MLYTLDDRSPEIDRESWAADSSEIIGSVRLLARASVWFGCVLRGDNALITIGEDSNVQDLSVLHTDADLPLNVGRGCTIGHQVMLHGCTIGDNTLIGIQSLILNHAVIGRDSVVGAGSVVTQGKIFPDGVLLLGSPAKLIRELKPEEIESNRESARHYVENARRYRAGLRRVESTL